MNIAPFRQTWHKIQVGLDHNGAPVFSGYKEIDLEFPSCSPTSASQWKNQCDGTAKTVDVLGEYSLGFVTLSSVYLIMTTDYAIENINATPFSIKIIKAY